MKWEVKAQSQRDDAINTIEGLYPLDTEYPETREVAKELLLQAIEETDWRNLPDDILFDYASLCKQREGI